MIAWKTLNDVICVPDILVKHLDLVYPMFIEDEKSIAPATKQKRRADLPFPAIFFDRILLFILRPLGTLGFCNAQSFDPSRRWFHEISERDRRYRSQNGGPGRSLRRSSSGGRFYLLTSEPWLLISRIAVEKAATVFDGAMFSSVSVSRQTVFAASGNSARLFRKIKRHTI